MPENLFKSKRAATGQPISPPVSQPVVEPAAPVAPKPSVERTTKPPTSQPVSQPVSQPTGQVDVESVTFKPAKPVSRVELEDFRFVPANAAVPTGLDYELSQEDTKELLTRLRAVYDEAPATYNQQVAPVFIQFSKERGITPADLMAGAARAGSDLQEIRRVAGQEYGDSEFPLTGPAAVGQAILALESRNLLPTVKTTEEASQRATIRAKERNTVDMLPEEDRQRKAAREQQLAVQAPVFAPSAESYAFGSPVASDDPEVAKGEEAERARLIVEAIPPARKLRYTTGMDRLSSDSLSVMKDAAQQIIGAEGVLMVINGEPINFRTTDARSILDEMKKQGVDLSRYGSEAEQLTVAGRVGSEVLRRAFGRSLNELTALRTVNGITVPIRLRIPYQMLAGIARSGEFDPMKDQPLFKPEDLEMTPEQIMEREGLSGLPDALLLATAPLTEIVGFKAGGVPGESQQAVLLRQQSATETWFDRSAMLYSLLKRNYTEPPIRITSEGVEMVGPSEYLGEVLGGMQRRESAFEDIANNEKVLAYLNFVNRWPDLAAAIRIKLPESYRLDYNGNGQIDYDDEDRYTGWKELKNDTSRMIAMGLGLGAEVVSPDLFDVAGPILSAGARGSLRAIRYNPAAVKVLRDEAAALADGDLETAASKARELGYRQGVSQEKAALDAEAVSSGNAPALANAAIVVDSVVAQEMRLAGKADEMFDTALVESLPVVKAEDAGDTLLDVERRKGYLHGSQRGKGDEDAMPTEGRRSRYGYKRALDDLDAMEAAVKRGEGYFPEKIKAATADSLAEAAAINDGAKVAVKAAADLIHRNRVSEAVRVAEAGLKAADIPADDSAKILDKIKEAADKAIEANKKALAEAPAAIERARKGVAQQVASRQRAVQELADFTENVEGRGRIGRWMNQNLPAIDRQLARFRQPGSFTSFITRQSLLDASAAMTVEQRQRRLKGALDGVESARKRKAAAEAAALKATASKDQAAIDAANEAIDKARERLVKAHEQVAAAITDGTVNGLSAGGHRLLGRLVDAFDDRFNEAELAATAVQYEGRALKMVEDGLIGSTDEWLDSIDFTTATAVPAGSADEVLESATRGDRAILKSESRALPEQILYQFAGEEGAQNLAAARRQLNLPGIDERYSLDTAKKRILAGETPETVRQETGWFLGMDDKWRFEIDDSTAAWKGDAVKWLEEGGDSVEAGQDFLVLEDVLDHPTLFEAYPGLRRMPIAFYDFEMAAGFSGKTGGITIGTKAKPGADRGMESLMHEIQHAIQVQEGFAVGGTPRLTAWAVPAYQPALAESAKRIKNKTPLTLKEYARQAWQTDKVTPEIKADYDWSYLPSFTAPGEAKVREMAAEDVYQRLAGEIEARNTAARRGMTAADRRAKAPDVDKTDVVVVFRGKEMRAEPANVSRATDTTAASSVLLDQAKAFVQFSADGRAVVSLMQKGDFSSLIHETAHIFRRTLSEKDNATVVKWARTLNLDVSLANGRFVGPDAIKAEEAFARGYERFVREGKSPVKALSMVFEKIKEWMRRTYQAVEGSPIDVKLNPDIEAVFANMTTPKAWMDEAKPTIMGEKIAPAMTAQDWLATRLSRAGVNLSADDIEKRLAAGETIELPFKVFGKNEINEEDLAKIQSSLDRVSALQEIKVDFTVPFDNVQQSVVEPTLVGELQSTMSADPTLRDTQAATRKVGRVTGRAVSAVMTGADALKNERVFSPRLRALAAEGGRILNQRVGDFNVLMRDASRSLDYQHLFDYMTGKDVKFSIGGRKPLSAGHDAVDEASQILQGQHGKLASDISIKTNKVDYGNPEDMPKDGWLGRDGSIVTDESLAAPPAQVVGDTVTLAFDAGAIADRDTRGARLAALFDGPNGRAHMLKTRATAIHMMESSPFLRHLATAVFDISDVDETRTAAEIIGTVAPDRILAYLEAVYKLAGGKIDVVEVGRRGLVFDPDLTSEEKVKAFFGVLTREKFGPVAVNLALSVVNVFGSQKTVYNRVADIGMTFSGEERKAFRNFLNGGFTTPQEYEAGLRMFAEFGFNYDALDEAAKVAGSVKSTRYMPNNVQRQIGRSLGRALDESTEVEKKVKGSGGRVPLFIKSAMQAVQSMFVRGRYIAKSAQVWMNLLDTGVMSGAVGGFSLGVESVVRQVLQSGFVSVQGHALTKLTTLGTVKTNQVREALQWIADQLVDRATGREFVASVNDTLRGANKVIRMPDGRRYTYSDLLQTAIANGVVASFETSELSENVRKAVEVGLARRFPGLPADAINWTDARKEEWIKANSELFETWAERERIGVMLGLMHRGQTPEQAARLTVKALFDYPGSLADTETKGSWSGLFLSLAQPYWTWQKNINHFLINALEEPAVQYRLGVVRRASEWGPEAVSQALYTVMVDPYGFDLDRMSPEERRIYFYLRAAYEESLGKESWQMSEEERLNFAAALWATHFQASETMVDGKLFHLRAEDAREVERRLRGSTAAMTLSEKYVPRPNVGNVPDYQRGRIRAILPFRNTEAMLDYIRNTDQQDLMMSLVFYEPGPIGGYNYLINSFRFVTAPLGILAATVAEQPTIDATLTARYIDGLADPERMPLVSETIVFLQGGSKTRLAGPVAQMFQSSDVTDRLLVYRKMDPVLQESFDRDIANGVDPREAGRRYGQVVYANPLVNLLFGIHPLLYDFNRTARMLETRGAFARDDEMANIRKVLLLSGVVSDVGEVSQRKTEERTVYEIPRKTMPR